MQRGRKPRTHLSYQQEVEIVEAYTEKTSSAKDLAEMYGLSDNRLYRILRNHKVPLHHPKKNGSVVLRKIDPKELEVPVHHTTPVEVVVDKESLVQRASRPVRRTETWEVKYEGTVLVEADDIEEAIREARKIGVVKRINSVRTVKKE